MRGQEHPTRSNRGAHRKRRIACVCRCSVAGGRWWTWGSDRRYRRHSGEVWCSPSASPTRTRRSNASTQPVLARGRSERTAAARVEPPPASTAPRLAVHTRYRTDSRRYTVGGSRDVTIGAADASLEVQQDDTIIHVAAKKCAAPALRDHPPGAGSAVARSKMARASAQAGGAA